MDKKFDVNKSIEKLIDLKGQFSEKVTVELREAIPALKQEIIDYIDKL